MLNFFKNFKYPYLYFGVALMGISVFQSCDYPCESNKIGDIALSEETNKFLPYQVDQELVFEDFDGNVQIFTVTEETGVSQLCVKVTCTPIDPYQSRGCDYYEGESHYFVMKDANDSIYLHAKSGIEPYEDAKELFYEFIEFGIGVGNNSLFAGNVTNVYFDDPIFEIENSIIDSVLIFKNIFTAWEQQKELIKHRILKDVWIEEVDSYALVIQENKGLVAFKLNNEWWFLKE